MRNPRRSKRQCAPDWVCGFFTSHSWRFGSGSNDQAQICYLAIIWSRKSLPLRTRETSQMEGWILSDVFVPRWERDTHFALIRHRYSAVNSSIYDFELPMHLATLIDFNTNSNSELISTIQLWRHIQIHFQISPQIFMWKLHNQQFTTNLSRVNPPVGQHTRRVVVVHKVACVSTTESRLWRSAIRKILGKFVESWRAHGAVTSFGLVLITMTEEMRR